MYQVIRDLQAAPPADREEEARQDQRVHRPAEGPAARAPQADDAGSPGEGRGSRAHLEARESPDQPHRAAAAENNCLAERFTSG
ncbi:hypothetical protein llap_22929 [Limosa lapponica baueri]|uniref:Uncharacterized protein n=1 Tax=Limosa lapponica baueri TaxID=1758121 RepID=A0A2I0SYY2_LIMLA|nr:hypothetical protein llap_22929 [Limosa lapponica baueri]